MPGAVNTEDKSEPLTFQDHASRFADLLSDEEDTQTGETPETQEDPESQPDGEQEQPDGESESQSEEPEEPTEEPDASAIDPRAVVKVTIDGQEQEVTLEEALKGYSRHQDYTRKTQALAEERKSHQGEFEAVRAERVQYATGLKSLEEALRAAVPEEPNWTEEAQNLSPQEFTALLASWQQHQRNLKGVAEERQRAEAKLAEDNAKAHHTWMLSERDKLMASVPEWKSVEVAKKEKAEIAAYATEKAGVTMDELRMAGSRELVLLRKAMLWDRAQSARTGTVKTLQGQGKIKVVTPGAAKAPVSQRAASVKDARASLRKSGSVKDAGRLFSQLLDD